MLRGGTVSTKLHQTYLPIYPFVFKQIYLLFLSMIRDISAISENIENAFRWTAEWILKAVRLQLMDSQSSGKGGGS